MLKILCIKEFSVGVGAANAALDLARPVLVQWMGEAVGERAWSWNPHISRMGLGRKLLML
jgi:hypothetical protein